MFKKYLPGLMAIALAISASAFTSRHSMDQLYYRNGDVIAPITPKGSCNSGSNFCTYTLQAGQPDDGDPSHYDGIGSQDKQWVPK